LEQARQKIIVSVSDDVSRTIHMQYIMHILHKPKTFHGISNCDCGLPVNGRRQQQQQQQQQPLCDSERAADSLSRICDSEAQSDKEACGK
jgi:hypothetical protein